MHSSKNINKSIAPICVECNNLIYSLNLEEKTAKLTKCKLSNNNIFIPSFIEYKMERYNIISISEKSFQGQISINCIQFSNDSELRIIEKEAFYGSSIKSLNVPSSLIDFEEAWCMCTPNLTKISVSPNNPRYKSYDDKFIIGKSSSESENYDLLVFSVRDIETAVIPDFIEIIGPFSFDQCTKLQNVEFSINSKLKSIEKNAFSSTSIKNIKIPQHLKCIDDFSFFACIKLQSIEIHENSELQMIGMNAFGLSQIDSLTIPSNLVELKEGWFYNMCALNKIIVSPNNPRYHLYENKLILAKSSLEKDNYDYLIFAVHCIKYAKIPDYVEIIKQDAFNTCYELQIVEFSNESKLEKIESSAFYNSAIEKIILPPNLKQIERYSFNYCNHLKTIDFSPDCSLQIIDEHAFGHTAISSFSFPHQVKKIGLNIFNYCSLLQIIEIDEKSEIEYININHFGFLNNTFVMISPILIDCIDQKTPKQ